MSEHYWSDRDLTITMSILSLDKMNDYKTCCSNKKKEKKSNLLNEYKKINWLSSIKSYALKKKLKRRKLNHNCQD